jgi:hypothetical protein
VHESLGLRTWFGQNEALNIYFYSPFRAAEASMRGNFSYLNTDDRILVVNGPRNLKCCAVFKFFGFDNGFDNGSSIASNESRELPRIPVSAARKGL